MGAADSNSRGQPTGPVVYDDKTQPQTSVNYIPTMPKEQAGAPTLSPRMLEVCKSHILPPIQLDIDRRTLEKEAIFRETDKIIASV